MKRVNLFGAHALTHSQERYTTKPNGFCAYIVLDLLINIQT